MDKDTNNYMQYKMGFCKKLYIAIDAVPTKFQCQEDIRKRRPDKPSREVSSKRHRIIIDPYKFQCQEDCRKQSEIIKKIHYTQNIIEPEGVKETKKCGRETHKGFTCGYCLKDTVGFRYTCIECENFDLCAECEGKMVHPQHYMLRVPRTKSMDEILEVIAAIREKIRTLAAAMNDSDIWESMPIKQEYLLDVEGSVSVKMEPEDQDWLENNKQCEHETPVVPQYPHRTTIELGSVREYSKDKNSEIQVIQDIHQNIQDNEGDDDDNDDKMTLFIDKRWLNESILEDYEILNNQRESKRSQQCVTVKPVDRQEVVHIDQNDSRVTPKEDIIEGTEDYGGEFNEP